MTRRAHHNYRARRAFSDLANDNLAMQFLALLPLSAPGVTLDTARRDMAIDASISLRPLVERCRLYGAEIRSLRRGLPVNCVRYYWLPTPEQVSLVESVIASC